MVIEFLANGFEEIEALTPIDVLRRAGVKAATVSIGDKTVVGSHGISVIADMTADELDSLDEDIEMIILPGGMPGAKNLDESAVVDKYLMRAAETGRYIASICAAPMIPGKRKLLSGRRATCYPGFEDDLAGARFTEGRVEVDGNMITSRGMGAALEFSLTLVGLLKGDVEADRIASSVFTK